MAQAALSSRVLKYADVGMAVMLVLVVAMMVIPVPTQVLDILLALNITSAVVIMLATFYVNQALEIAAFPTILLIATLFRLSLNLSTTRLILARGDAGGAEDGARVAAR